MRWLRWRTSGRRRCTPRRRRRPGCSGRPPRRRTSSVSPCAPRPRRCPKRRTRQCDIPPCGCRRGRSAYRALPKRRCSSPPPPSRAPAPRRRRWWGWERLPLAWLSSGGRAAHAGSPRRTCSPVRDRRAALRRPRKGLFPSGEREWRCPWRPPRQRQDLASASVRTRHTATTFRTAAQLRAIYVAVRRRSVRLCE